MECQCDSCRLRVLPWVFCHVDWFITLLELGLSYNRNHPITNFYATLPRPVPKVKPPSASVTPPRTVTKMSLQTRELAGEVFDRPPEKSKLAAGVVAYKYKRKPESPSKRRRSEDEELVSLDGWLRWIFGSRKGTDGWCALLALRFAFPTSTWDLSKPRLCYPTRPGIFFPFFSFFMLYLFFILATTITLTQQSPQLLFLASVAQMGLLLH